MTVTEMCEAINFNIRSIYPDKVYLDVMILKALNRELQEIAGAYFLPALNKTRTIAFEAYEDSVTGYEAKCKLPSDFSHDIHFARNLTQESGINIYSNVAAIKRDYNESNPTGSIEAIACDGADIWGYLCPETEEEIEISYYKAPDTLVAASTPDCIPTRLQEGVLVDGVTARLMKRIPEEVKVGGVNMKYHLGEAQKALADLGTFCKNSPRLAPYRKRTLQFF